MTTAVELETETGGSVSTATILRWGACLFVVLALLVISVRTALEIRSASEAAGLRDGVTTISGVNAALLLATKQQLYIEGGFFAVIAVGLGVAVYIGSRGED